MASPQTGLFALGTASHAYLELDVVAGASRLRSSPRSPPSASHGRRSAGSTSSPASGPELWLRSRPMRRLAVSTASRMPSSGQVGTTLPATQHDVVVWLTGASYDVVFDLSRAVVMSLAGSAVLDTRARRLAVSPRPRPHGVHRRDREPDAGRGLGGGRRPGRRGRRGRVDPAASAVGARCDRPGRRSRSTPRRTSSAGGRPTARSSTRGDPRRMWRERTRRHSARSSDGTSRTGRSSTTGRSSWASVASSGAGVDAREHGRHRRPARRARRRDPSVDRRVLRDPVGRCAGAVRGRGPMIRRIDGRLDRGVPKRSE